jgi:glycosyltransferase involved in cell wall biosynthesis
MTDVPLAVQAIMGKKNQALGKVVVYEDIIYSFSHNFFHKHFDLSQKDQIRFAYSMVESSEVQKRWVYNLNHYFDAVLVPDPFLVDVYKNSGVTIPVFSLPLGLNLKKFLEKPLKNQAHTPFVFANFSACILRKNQHVLIDAFHQAFGNNPAVRLWINCRVSEGNLFQDLQDKVSSLGVSNIVLSNNCYNNTEYLQNFDKIDCYVSLSKAEGFSIQPREAMALGIPCIVSDNTAQTTICKSGCVKTLSCPIKEPAYYEIFKDVFGFYYNVELQEVSKALKEVYEEYDRHLQFSESARVWVSQYDYAALHPLYKSLIKPQLVVMGDEDRIECNRLITTSSTLYEKYQAIKSTTPP